MRSLYLCLLQVKYIFVEIEKKTKEIFFPLGNCEMSEVANARKKMWADVAKNMPKKSNLAQNLLLNFIFHYVLCSVEPRLSSTQK